MNNDQVIEAEFSDEFGQRQLLRTTALGGAHLAKALIDALKDKGYGGEETADGGE